MNTQDLQKTRLVAATIDANVSSAHLPLQRAIEAEREGSVIRAYEAVKNGANEYSMESDNR